MIDTGRRFYSVELVESVLDGMAMMKVGGLHVHMFKHSRHYRAAKMQSAALQMNMRDARPYTLTR
jgi:hypothetical protein